MVTEPVAEILTFSQDGENPSTLTPRILAWAHQKKIKVLPKFRLQKRRVRLVAPRRS